MAEKVRMTVFETKASSEALTEIVHGLSLKMGNSVGREIIPRKTAGLYLVQNYDGNTISHVGAVRIIGSQIWAREYAPKIESALAKKGIAYATQKTEVDRLALHQNATLNDTSNKVLQK